MLLIQGRICNLHNYDIKMIKIGRLDFGFDVIG